jgi:uncharacterized protein (DUF2147 family)
MKRLLALAAFLLASNAAQAQYSFQYGGHTINIDPDRGTVSIPGVYDNTGRKSKRAHKTDQDLNRKQPQAPQQAKVDPQAPAAPPAEAATTPAAEAAAPAAQAPVAPVAPAQAPTTTANNAPADTATLPPPATPSAAGPAPQQDAVAPQAQPGPSLMVVPAPAPQPPAPPPLASSPQQTAAAAPAVRDPNSPIGVWLTEEKEGMVRIEQCGANLCGYSVDSKSNLNGEQVLINMKPGRDQKWSGRILDPNTGSTYDSTIALKGPDTLRVQGCAFGGMFCGGQTWTRMN